MDIAVVGGPSGHVGGRGGDFPFEGPQGFKKNALKPWLSACWCLPPKHNAEFVYAMEDVLATYSRTFNAGEVLVCLDETSKQQTKETRTPLPPRPGQRAVYDVEYERNGTANLFMMTAPSRRLAARQGDGPPNQTGCR